MPGIPSRGETIDFAGAHLHSHSTLGMKNEMNSIEDIDWKLVEEIFRANLPKLVAQATTHEKIDLVIWSDSNGGFNFDCYQKFPDGSLQRLGDKLNNWNVEWEHLDEEFERLLDHFSENDDFESCDQIDLRLKNSLSRVAQDLESKNFGFPRSILVKWKVQGA